MGRCAALRRRRIDLGEVHSTTTLTAWLVEGLGTQPSRGIEASTAGSRSGTPVLLPVLLAAQAAAVIALANQRDRTHGTERLERAQVARHLALLVSQRLEGSPQAPLAGLVAGLQPSTRLFVVMKTGAVLENRGPGPDVIDEFVVGLPKIDDAGSFPEEWSGGDFGATPLLVEGKVVGLVGITPRSMFERYGGVMVALGTALLFVGNLALALLVIQPIRSRLGGLRSAAVRAARR